MELVQRTFLRELRQLVNQLELPNTFLLAETADRVLEEVLVVIEARACRDVAAIVLAREETRGERRPDSRTDAVFCIDVAVGGINEKVAREEGG